MTNTEWRTFLVTARKLLGKGATLSWGSDSWCAFTTFSSLEHELTYWACGIPDENEFLENQTIDGGLWRQSFSYDDLAHFIIPAKFYWEKFDSEKAFQFGYKYQNILALSDKLKFENISHRITEKVLEIKLY